MPENADHAIRYAGQTAAIGTAGLAEVFDVKVPMRLTGWPFELTQRIAKDVQ
ncbi:hypothetical protein HWB60_gp096 [Mycobacterium phage TChen]|uniref:Uncharacterized protein n=1 Tax=Mycobacterium phage TChen TaxID=2163598 RepID=A0A2S1PD42_9CAUD|nr:hypothetical protein HWB60_gp096 [Mycobacterium phage TChen]AWH14490.1 hypothetical protein SEA_TCHEN_96 [Mycobacterium phage TChen]